MNEESIQECEKKTSEKRKRNHIKSEDLDRNQDISLVMNDHNPFKVLINDENTMPVVLENIESGKRSKKESKKVLYPEQRLIHL